MLSLQNRRRQPSAPQSGVQEGLRLLLELVDNARVQQRRRVAETRGVVLGDLSEDAPHDLAAPRLRQRAREENVVRLRERPDRLPNAHDQLLLQGVIALDSFLQDDVTEQARTLHLVRETDDGCLRSFWVSNERVLNLGTAYAVTGDVDHIVDTACDPIVAVLVAHARVACEVVAGVRLQVDVQEPLVVAVHRPQHGGPTLLEDEHAGNIIALQLHARRRVQHAGVDAEHRQGARARLEDVAPRHRRHHEAPSLRLPEGVDDGTPLVPDDVVVPAPSLRVDRLTHRSQDPQRGPVVLLDRLVTEAHERSDRGGRRVELRDLVPLDHVPIATAIRVRRY
mmetsp:Transcript_37253/g.99429  ORF Transcript_37253/g.99429 Transcript_37253/m.99429 type:complete len:338 (-) Transcript_37253:1076-2089(-)